MVNVSAVGRNRDEGLLEVFCLSTDVKPLIWNGVAVSNGSILTEMDTSKVFLYDAENARWREFSSTGSGGGGGGSDEYAPLASPAFTGIPTAPTAVTGTDTTQIATTAFVQSAVSDTQQAIDAAIAALLPVDTVSGAVASFPDAIAAPAKSLTTTISPAQDLHGQDAPYPAGGGKNIIPYPYFTASGTTIDGVTFNYQSDGKITASGTSGGVGLNFNLAQGFAFTAGTYTLSITGNHTGVRFLVYDRTNLAVVAVIESGSADASKTFSVASDLDNVNIYFNRGATAGEVNISAYIQIEKGSSATPYAPYSNICPISGWDAVNVTRTGKNLLNADTAAWATNNNYLYQNGVVPPGQLARFTFSDKDTSVDISGCYLGFVADDLSAVNVATNFRWVINNGNVATVNTSNRSTQDATVLCRNVFIYPKTAETFEKLFSRFDIMVELGETATAYAPYTGQTYPVDLGRTVYGGSLDVTSGVLTVDRVLETLDGTEPSSMRNTWGHTYNRNDLKRGNATQLYAISSQYTPGNNYWSTAGTGEILTNNNAYIIMDDRFNTSESWKAHLAEEYQNGTPVQVVYRLEEPQTYQLTPTEVDMLLGDNCIWADTGNVTVVYTADIQRYIEKKLG